ncbi:hypothetical protein NA57DRAFT_55587 [Rhizodiscina lignyota]|uniref:Uncharacterized protein n=1 Tax=Rhizodiscina lignyota TaxID=1504668 RepID=A0A9P4ID34_9PEZI|nr:hypothetical protein NA57DRAFT_55587 [Rhizodiscina lignyota]
MAHSKPHYSFFLLSHVLIAIFCGVNASSIPSTTRIIPSTTVTGPVTVQTVSDNTPINFPKLSAVNDTTPEFWFFAAVSPDLNASATVTFFTTTEDGFEFVGDSGSVDTVLVQITFPNGTSFSTELAASEAVITSSTGDLTDTADDVSGSISITAIAPPHYPFSPVEPGQTLEVAPNLGWENAVPGATANVKVNIQGTPVEFTGIGYQDHNWSPAPFLSIFSSYYWGLTQLGPYTLVWFDVFDLSGVEHVSSYVAANGAIIVAEKGSNTVVPFGANDEFPPHAGDGDPTGFNITVDLGKEGILEATVTAEVVLAEVEGLFTRWISKAEGGIKGGTQYEGPAMNEEFRLT